MTDTLASALSWSLRYGITTWVFAAALCIGAVLLAVVLRLHKRAAERAATVRAELDSTTTFRGVFRGKWLDTPKGEKIYIESTVNVSVGSWELWMTKDVPEAAHLAPGDEIIVNGTIEERASEDYDGEYRSGAVERFFPHPVEAVFAGTPKVSGPGISALAGWALIAAMGVGIITASVGTVSRDLCWASKDWACEVALATPFHRSEVIGALLTIHAPRGDDSYDDVLRYAALEMLVDGNCQRAMHHVSLIGDSEWVANLGEACETASSMRLAAAARYDMGDFAKAAELTNAAPPAAEPERWHTDNEIRIKSAVGDYAGAASAAMPRYRCIGYGFMALAGRKDAALPSLRTHAKLDDCALVLAWLSEGDERLEVLKAHVGGGDYRRRRIRQELAMLADPHHARHTPPVLSRALDLVNGEHEPRGDSVLTMMVAESLQQTMSPRLKSDRVAYALDAAQLMSLMGSPTDARRWMQIARADSNDDHFQSHIALMEAAIEIRAGDLDAASKALASRDSDADGDADGGVATQLAEIIATRRGFSVVDDDDLERRLRRTAGICRFHTPCDHIRIGSQAADNAIEARRAGKSALAEQLDGYATKHRAALQNHDRTFLITLLSLASAS